MKTLLFSSILITLFACGNDKATVSKDPKSADTAIVKSDQVAPQKEIKQLPQIALYANEIGIPDESMGRGKELKFILKGEQLVLENSDESSFEYQENTNIISIKERSGGTGSEYTWNTTFRLLGEAPFPTVICLKRESEEIFLGPQNRRDIDELAFELAAEANEPEEDWYEVATMMVDRNDQTTYLQDPTSLGGYDSYSVSISAFQKREGKWEQLENILPTDFKERCTKFFPINELNSANLIEINNDYNSSFIEANQSIFNAWCNARIHHLDKNKLSIGCKDNPTFILRFEKDRFVYDKSPDQLPDFKTISCEALDLTGTKLHTFKGKIGDDNNIVMDLRFTQVGQEGSIPKVKMKGQYYYTRGSSKMDLEGEFLLSVNQPISFFRMKDGKKREVFDLFFLGCEMKGWWEHEKRPKSINSFELSLME